jgi:hypothetical protein
VKDRLAAFSAFSATCEQPARAKPNAIEKTARKRMIAPCLQRPMPKTWPVFGRSVDVPVRPRHLPAVPNGNSGFRRASVRSMSLTHALAQGYHCLRQ